MSSTPVPEACETAYTVTFHPIYRGSQFLQIIILIIAIFPLIYFLWFKLRKSRFHGNLKWLLIAYFISVLAFTIHLLILAVIQVIYPLLSLDKCSLIISPFPYAIANILAAFLMTMATYFPISITIERFFATKMAEKYDKTPVLMGPALAIFDVVLNLYIVLKIFQDETFGDGSAFLVLIPATSASKIYTVYWTMFILNLINILFNIQLLRQNSRLKKIDGSLSSKYQLEEVYQSTVFSVSVIFIHIFIFGLYIFLTIFFRYFGNTIIGSSTTLIVVRGALITVIAIYNLLIGFVAVYSYQRLKTKKSMEISGTIGMKSTGGAGAKNYEEAIHNIWNSHVIL